MPRMGKTGRLSWLECKMMLWNTGLAQGNTETNELGYNFGLKRVFSFSECKTLPDFASITIAAYGATNPQKGNTLLAIDQELTILPLE